jgi:integrase
VATQRGQVFKLKKKGPDGKPLWAYRYRVGGRDSKRVQQGGFVTEREADKALADELRKHRNGIVYRPELTVADLVDEYLAQKVDLEPNSRRTLEYRLQHSKRSAADGGLGDVKIHRLDARTISEWRATLSPLSAWHYHKALSQVLNYAARVKLLDSNPARDVPNPEPRRAEIVPFDTLADVEEVALNLPPHLRAIPMFGALTGLRSEEWIPLRRRDLDLHVGEVHVRRIYTDGTLKPARAKGKGARRSVPLLDEAVALMSSWPIPLDPDGLVFPAERGGLIDLHYFRGKPWEAAILAAGIEPRRTPYALRHTYAAHMLAAGVPSDTLARYMGTSLSQIEKTYGHLIPNTAETMRRLGNEYLRGLREREEQEAAGN